MTLIFKALRSLSSQDGSYFLNDIGNSEKRFHRTFKATSKNQLTNNTRCVDVFGLKKGLDKAKALILHKGQHRVGNI